MMAEPHDFKKYPELTNKQMAELELISPHAQIKRDFAAEVVKVHDGDTIRLRTDFRDFDFPLRFLKIDAPELNEGGEAARDWLKDRIEGKIVQVIINMRDRVDKYGRLLGSVLYGGSIINEEMVRLGLVQLFEVRGEKRIPNINKMLSVKQWL